MRRMFLIALGAFYPIVDQHHARRARRRPQPDPRRPDDGRADRDLVLRVVLPDALPAIFTGCGIGLGVAWTAVIVAEIVAVKSGLGYVLWDAYYVGRMDVVHGRHGLDRPGWASCRDRLMLLAPSARAALADASIVR